MKNTIQPITIKLPGNEYPYMNCQVEVGNPADLSEKLVFTTVSKAGRKRRVTIHPNGTVIEQEIAEKEEETA